MHKRARNPSQMAENCPALISEPLTLTAPSSRVVLLGCSRKGIKAILLICFIFWRNIFHCITREDFAQNLIGLFRAHLHKLLTSTRGQKLREYGQGWGKQGLGGAKSREMKCLSK